VGNAACFVGGRLTMPARASIVARLNAVMNAAFAADNTDI
jgi:hypothetical protein